MELSPSPLHSHGPAPRLECLWIENEGLLRDEGVVFGLSHGAHGLAEKEDCIRAYYQRCVAEGERRRAAIQAELNVLADEERRLQEGDPPLAAHALEDEAPATAFSRDLANVLLVAASCVCGGVLVYEVVRSAFEAPAWVAAGVTLAGMFTGFLPISYLFSRDAALDDGAELWKVRLAELGMPAASAFFVVAWVWERLGALRAIATLAFLFLFFAFAGRLLLSTVARMGSTVRGALRGRAASRRRAEEAERRKNELERLRKVRERRAELRLEESSIPSTAEWDAVCHAKLHLFRSEYELAAAARSFAAMEISPPALSVAG